MKKEILVAKLKEVLENDIDIIKEVVSEVNGWNGGLDDLIWQENDEEFFNIYFEGKPMEAVRSASYGEYNYMDEYVKFNGYGNLESANQWKVDEELSGSIDEVIESLIEEYCHIDISNDEVKELMEAYENGEEIEEDNEVEE